MNRLQIAFILLIIILTPITTCTADNQVRPEPFAAGLDLVIYDMSYGYCEKALIAYGYEAYLGLKLINSSLRGFVIPLIEAEKLHMESLKEWADLIYKENRISQRLSKRIQRIVDRILGLIPTEDMELFWNKNETTRFLHVIIQASFYALADAIRDSIEPYHTIYWQNEDVLVFEKTAKLSFTKEQQIE